MRKQEGITIVSLVVTIIILIILAGVSINATLGEHGIITIARQAKENIQLAQEEEQTELNELYMQMQADDKISGGISYDAIAKLTEFKKIIAEAITNKGIDTSESDTAEKMAENIGSIASEPELVTVTKTHSFSVSAYSSAMATVSFSEFSNLIGITEISGRVAYGGSSPITVNRDEKKVTISYGNNNSGAVTVKLSITAIGTI